MCSLRRQLPQWVGCCPPAAQPALHPAGVPSALQGMAGSRSSLHAARLMEGVPFWLARQRWLWCQGRLPLEQELMLQLAGVELDSQTPAQWRASAHEAAEYLQGTSVPTQSTPPAQAAAASSMGSSPSARPLPAPSAESTAALGPARQPSPSRRMAAAQLGAAGPSAAGLVAAALGRPAEPQAAARPVAGPLPYAKAPPGRPAGRRCAVRRWVLVQRAMWHAGRFTTAQLRYMTVLGELALLCPGTASQTSRSPAPVWQPASKPFAECFRCPRP